VASAVAERTVSSGLLYDASLTAVMKFGKVPFGFDSGDSALRTRLNTYTTLRHIP